MNTKIVEDLEFFKGISVIDQLKQMIDDRNKEDSERFYYMIGTVGYSKEEKPIPEMDIRIDSCLRTSQVVLKESETLLYP